MNKYLSFLCLIFINKLDQILSNKVNSNFEFLREEHIKEEDDLFFN